MKQKIKQQVFIAFTQTKKVDIVAFIKPRIRI
jgi:hypothetical protein